MENGRWPVCGVPGRGAEQALKVRPRSRRFEAAQHRHRARVATGPHESRRCKDELNAQEHPPGTRLGCSRWQIVIANTAQQLLPFSGVFGQHGRRHRAWFGLGTHDVSEQPEVRPDDAILGARRQHPRPPAEVLSLFALLARARAVPAFRCVPAVRPRGRCAMAAAGCFGDLWSTNGESHRAELRGSAW